MAFTVTSVEGMVHEDTWTADSGTGSCKAVWGMVAGAWLIVKDDITFVPTPKKMTLEEAQSLVARESELEANLEAAIESEDFGLCGGINKELEVIRAI